MKVFMSPTDQALLYHTVMIGAANFIPIPLVDDFIVQKLRQRMVKELGKHCAGRVISTAEAQALLNYQPRGCAEGCLGVFVLAVKDLVREIIFILDIRRGMGLMTEAYCRGVLLMAIFTSGKYYTGYARRYGRVISWVIARTNTDLVKNIFSGTFKTTRHTFRTLARWIWDVFIYFIRRVAGFLVKGFRRLFKGRRHKKEPGSDSTNPTSPDFETIFAEQKPELNPLIASLAEQFQANLGKLPGEYFETMKKQVVDELIRQGAWGERPLNIPPAAGARSSFV